MADRPEQRAAIVAVVDPSAARLARVRALVQECGAVCAVGSAESLVDGGRGCVSPKSHIGLVAVDDGPETLERSFDLIAQFVRRGHVVLAYGSGTEQWPLGAQARALLAGAAGLFDSRRADFVQLLGDALRRQVQSELGRFAEEHQLQQAMSQVGIVGQSRPMLALFRRLLRISKVSDLPVLITGETGSGKELVARAIGRLDPKRAEQPFIAVNCAALSPALLEAELFGHRRGAFTGADHARPGIVRAADGGIVFLDEIGELDAALQAKLLRMLQERCVRAVGEEIETRVDVRVLAATNRDLAGLVRDGRMRADLFFRLNVVSVHVPALRDRREDLAALAAHFVQKHRTTVAGRTVAVDSALLAGLAELPLPGNVREVENLIRTALVNKEDDGPLGLRDMPVEVWKQLAGSEALRAPVHTAETRRATPGGPPLATQIGAWVDSPESSLRQALEQCERLLIATALERSDGNQTRAARLLGVSARTIYNKMRHHHL